MAYKFQLGAFVASGSIKAEEGFDANSQNIASVLTASILNLDVNQGSASIDADGLGTFQGGLNAADAGIASAGDIAGVTTISGSGKFQMASMALGGTDVTATAAELNYLDGANSNINSLVLPASTTISNYASSSLLNNADEAAFKAAVNLEIGTDVQAQDAGLQYLANLTITDESTFQEQVGLEIGVDVQAYDAQLADIAGLSPTDGNFIVGDGSNFVLESGATARTSLGLGTIATQNSGTVNIDGGNIDGAVIGANSAVDGTFALMTAATGSITGNLTVNGDLTILGTTVSASVSELLIEDYLIRVADGQASLGAQYGAGFEIGNNLASFKTANADISGDGAEDYFASSLPLSASTVYGGTFFGGEVLTSDWDITATHISGGLPVSASAFYGDGSNLTGVSADSVTLTPVSKADGNTLEANKVNYFSDNSNATWSVTLPSSPSAGDYIYIKAANITGTGNIVINRAGSQTIDGAISITLESPYAAVTLIYVASNDWRVF